jgi:hypothetical protein
MPFQSVTLQIQLIQWVIQDAVAMPFQSSLGFGGSS